MPICINGSFPHLTYVNDYGSLLLLTYYPFIKSNRIDFLISRLYLKKMVDI